MSGAKTPSGGSSCRPEALRPSPRRRCRRAARTPPSRARRAGRSRGPHATLEPGGHGRRHRAVAAVGDRQGLDLHARGAGAETGSRTRSATWTAVSDPLNLSAATSTCGARGAAPVTAPSVTLASLAIEQAVAPGVTLSDTARRRATPDKTSFRTMVVPREYWNRSIEPSGDPGSRWTGEPSGGGPPRPQGRRHRRGRRRRRGAVGLAGQGVLRRGVVHRTGLGADTFGWLFVVAADVFLVLCLVIAF